MATFRHWTAAVRVPQILQDGFIRTTDPVLSMYKPGGPQVVWLLPSDVDPGTGHDNGLSHQKRDGWIDVNVPAIRWLDWEPQHRMDPEWRDTIISAGGGIDIASRWYVWPAPIRRVRFTGWHPASL